MCVRVHGHALRGALADSGLQRRVLADDTVDGLAEQVRMTGVTCVLRTER